MKQNAFHISPLVLWQGNGNQHCSLSSAKSCSLCKCYKLAQYPMWRRISSCYHSPAWWHSHRGDRHNLGSALSLPNASDQAKVVETQKNEEYLFLQVLHAVRRANQKKHKTNQERLMNKNNRLSAFLLVISPPQTAVMWKVLKFKSHLSLTSADRLPMQ